MWGAAHTAARELEKATGCIVQVSVYPTGRGEVWRLSARLLEQVDGKPKAIRIQTAMEWPNVSYQGMAATWYELVHRLGVLNEQDVMAGATGP